MSGGTESLRLMKFIVLFGVIALVILCFALGSAGHTDSKPFERWANAYWVWQGEAPARSEYKPNLLYVQIQGIQWLKLPDAGAYIIVNRISPETDLSDELVTHIAQSYQTLLSDAGEGRHIKGLQIDYDCPTNRLKSYSRFLGALRKQLPPGTLLSITALLDWFTPGGNVDSVIAVVDEFVPQFYDVSTRKSSGIGERIDPVKWAPIFNGLKTPYKIGVSSFGRIARRRIASEGASVQYFRDASPLDFARPEYRRSSETTPAGEFVLRYEVTATPSAPGLLRGDAVEITFPTEASVRRAYDAVRQFGGFCSGAIFFRWPTESEALALKAEEVERILRGGSLTSQPELELRDGYCIERRCTDLYLKLGRDFAARDRVIEIAARGSMDLFIPGGPLRTMAVRNRILISVPAYSGVPSIYLGRAMSKTALQFEVSNP
jgi:hypothetical protein